jgi:hypothetical protein
MSCYKRRAVYIPIVVGDNIQLRVSYGFAVLALLMLFIAASSTNWRVVEGAHTPAAPAEPRSVALLIGLRHMHVEYCERNYNSTSVSCDFEDVLWPSCDFANAWCKQAPATAGFFALLVVAMLVQAAGLLGGLYRVLAHVVASAVTTLLTLVLVVGINIGHDEYVPSAFLAPLLAKPTKSGGGSAMLLLYFTPFVLFTQLVLAAYGYKVGAVDRPALRPTMRADVVAAAKAQGAANADQ